MNRDRLVTPSYCCILLANFLLFFGFYLLMPVMPFYLTEVFGAGRATVGVALSCYVIAALSIRPFSGYLLDTFARRFTCWPISCLPLFSRVTWWPEP